MVYQHLAGYRSAVFAELVARSPAAVRFAAGAETREGIRANTDEQVQSRLVPLRNRWIGPFLWQAGLLRLVWASSRYDRWILLGDYRYLSTWVALLLLRTKGNAAWLWTHGTLADESGQRTVRERIRRLLYRQSSGLLLYGDHAAAVLRPRLPPRIQLTVVHNSISTPITEELLRAALANRAERRVAAGVKPGRTSLLFVGRVLKDRRLDRLVERVAEVGLASQVRLVVVGEGPACEALIATAARFGVAIDVRGAVYDTELLLELTVEADAGVYLFAGGLGITHCLGFGLPILTTDDRRLHKPEWESLTKETAWFVDAELQSLADALAAVSVEGGSLEKRLAALAVARRLHDPAEHAMRILDAVGLA